MISQALDIDLRLESHKLMASIEQSRTALAGLIDQMDGVDHSARSKKLPDRTIELVLLDLDAHFSGHWRGGELCELAEGRCESKPNVHISMSSDDLIALTEGRLSFAHAWATGRVRLDASFRDLLRLRKLL